MLAEEAEALIPQVAQVAQVEEALVAYQLLLEPWDQLTLVVAVEAVVEAGLTVAQAAPA
jgi:hypothetical protein